MPNPVWTYSMAGDVFERLEYLTDAQDAPTGEDQVRRLRQAPRVILGFDCQETKRARRQMEHALAAHGGNEWDVPLVQDATQASAVVTGALDLTIDADTAHRRFTVGGRVLVMADNPRHWDVGTITDLTEVSMVLDCEATHTWGAGTWVMPLCAGRLTAVPLLSRFTGNDGQAQVEFRLDDVPADPEDAGAASYRGYPVLELRPDWSKDPEVTFQRALMEVDNQTAPVSVLDMVGHPLTLQSAQYSPQGLAAIVAFRSLLRALGGRWGTLWVPSHAQDFEVVGDIGAAEAFLDVDWSGFADFDLHHTRRDLRIETDAGAVYYRRITSSAALGDEAERLTLDSALGVAIPANRVAAVSFLSLAHQDSDINLLRYWKRDLVQAELRFRGVSASGI